MRCGNCDKRLTPGARHKKFCSANCYNEHRADKRKPLEADPVAVETQRLMSMMPARCA